MKTVEKIINQFEVHDPRGKFEEAINQLLIEAKIEVAKEIQRKCWIDGLGQEVWVVLEKKITELQSTLKENK